MKGGGGGVSKGGIIHGGLWHGVERAGLYTGGGVIYEVGGGTIHGSLRYPFSVYELPVPVSTSRPLFTPEKRLGYQVA